MRQESRRLAPQASVQVLAGSFVISIACGKQKPENRAARRSTSKWVLGRLRFRWGWGCAMYTVLGAGGGAKQKDARGKQAGGYAELLSSSWQCICFASRDRTSMPLSSLDAGYVSFDVRNNTLPLRALGLFHGALIDMRQRLRARSAFNGLHGDVLHLLLGLIDLLL